MGVSTVVGALSGLANLAGAGDSSGTVGGLLSGSDAAAPVVASAALSDQQFVDLVAVAFAGSNQKGWNLGAAWKANRKKLLASDDLAHFQELGLIADAQNLSKVDQQFIALFALAATAASKPIATVIGQWKTARGANNIGSPGNLDLFREWGVIG